MCLVQPGKKSFFLFFFTCTVAIFANAQGSGCFFRDTAFFFNFGTEKNPTQFGLTNLKNYKRVYTPCPDDGFYSYTSMTSDCFFGTWITLNEDHTPGDAGGRMMLINASERTGDFFVIKLKGLKPATNYECAAWLINICKPRNECPPLLPDIRITLWDASEKKITGFQTGQLTQSDNPAWKRYAGMFTTPDIPSAITLQMTNTVNGGCGNDFAMDDITIRECYPTPPPIVKPGIVIKKKPPIVKPKIIPQKKKPAPMLLKKSGEVVKNFPAGEPPLIQKKNITPAPANIRLPLALSARKNPIVKQIETSDEDVLVEVYDNGEIDGDTVSIYHNNELIVSHRGLSAKPISFSIKVDSSQSYHEIVMVADNLGSIPPNTSLMIVTAGKKRYEVFISSTEQKNAKVIIQGKK